MVLWRRESNDDDAPFIHLFERLAPSHMVVAFQNWNNHLDAVSQEIEARKSNETSNTLREAGNRKFREKDFIGAMELYNKSLCFAEPETDNVCFAYANRASCFLRLGKFDKCLRDIDLAAEANYPFMPKCQRAMGSASATNEPIPLSLSYEPNEKYPCIVDVLDVQKNAEFGRHIVANSDIAVGQTVLIEKNYISLGCATDRGQCYGCMKEGQNFIACPKCTDVMFCSKECQNSIIHGKICGEVINRMPYPIRFVAESVLTGLFAFESADDLMQFVNDVLQKRTEIPPAANDQASKYGFFLSLQSMKHAILTVDEDDEWWANHETLKEVSDSLGFIYVVFTALLTTPYVQNMFNTSKRQRFLMHLVAQHIFIMHNNSFDLSVPSGVIGNKIGLVSSLFNHACAPNVLDASKSGDTNVFISIRPIKAGDQVFVCYGYPLDQLTVVRRAVLKKTFDFDCNCDKCKSHFSTRDRSLMVSNPKFQFLRTARRQTKLENLADLKDDCVAFLNECGHLPWTNEMQFVLDIFTNILVEELKN